MKEIREMLRELMLEINNEREICIYNRKKVNMIIERIISKIDLSNLPDIDELKKIIEKETKVKPFLSDDHY